MGNMINFVVSNPWMWVLVALALIPLGWGLFVFAVQLYSSARGEECVERYHCFWEYCVRLDRDSYHRGWAKLFYNKFMRLLMIVSLYFVWGYVLVLLGLALGWLFKIIFGNLWKGIKALYNMI